MNWLVQLSTNAFVIAAITWLAKKVVTHYFDSNLEAYKVALQRETDLVLESVRIHDRARVEAHQRLFVFAKRVQNETFPLADGKRVGFERVMREHYLGGVQFDQMYFDDEIANALDRFDDMYVCMGRGELILDTEDEVDAFLGGAFEQAAMLAERARLATQPVRTRLSPESGQS